MKEIIVAKLFKHVLPVVSVSFLTLATLTSTTHAAITNPYPEQLQEVLSKYHIDKTNIRSQKTLEKRAFGRSDDRNSGYTTYIDFKDCKGYLAVSQHRFGRVDNVYIKGECQIPGIKNF
ncbi:hypothetical protein A9Q97_00080 [Rhodospirillales bacterium 47_12_T64]|nr:hypothetical protein A9Q97_00080 [Rhodospirillales bacterium 47_12_T64]